MSSTVKLNPTLRTDLIPVAGMDCSDCVLVLEHALGRVEGVVSASANYAGQTVQVEYDPERANRAVIERRIRSLGYDVPETGLRAQINEQRELLLSLLAGLFLLMGWLGERFLGWPQLIYLALYAATYITAGTHVARHAWHALRERHFDTDMLMLAAALGAAALGAFAEGALLLTLFSLGHALEERALDQARDAVRSLAQLAPRTALTRRDGVERELPVEELVIGDTVIVRPGARLPVDGEVSGGTSAVDQAPVTGESTPVEVEPGSTVFAGTINGDGALTLRVTRLAQDSTLARVMRMVEEAQAQKSPTQQTVESVMQVFVPTVLIGAGLLIVVPPLLGMPFRESFLRAMTLLVAASPCALALGTPAAVLAGVARAARGGVLVKGGAHLENLGRLRAVAFDKTGTITMGQPQVVGSYGFNGASANWRILAAAAESRSGHPLARAITRAGSGDGELPAVSALNTAAGLGVQATVAGHEVWVGSLRYIAEAGTPVAPAARAQARIFESSGATVVGVAVDGTPVGLLALADTLREDAPAVIRSLKTMGIEQTTMLTGDNERVAQYIAAEAGLDSYVANLLPGDKAQAVDALTAQYIYAGMVGDGVNDAPALARATVGIAMGAAGSDVALEAADVALMGDDLNTLPFAVGLGRATRAVILQNLVIALGVIVLLVGAALTGAAGIGVAVLLHEGSTLLVALNALRLLRYVA
jgi:Cd2+/Zn2+-exporting ATPase